MTDQDTADRLRVIFSEIKEQAGDSADWLKQYEVIALAADRIGVLNRRLIAEENAYEVLRNDIEHITKDRNNLAIRCDELNQRNTRLLSQIQEMEAREQ